jgi:anaerobic selenocysteine-containing dehydrogenase
MKYAVCVVASVVLAGCNEGPTVELHNATGQQVAQAVTKAGVMNSDSMVEPGLWRSKATVEEMNIPGIPAQYAAQMKQNMAEHRNDSSSHCI